MAQYFANNSKVYFSDWYIVDNDKSWSRNYVFHIISLLIDEKYILNIQVSVW